MLEFEFIKNNKRIRYTLYNRFHFLLLYFSPKNGTTYKMVYDPLTKENSRWTDI